MIELALVGDIGGTNSRFGLVEPGTTRVAEVAVQKNDDFASLEDSIAAYVKAKGVSGLAGAAIAVAGPVEGEVVHLTNRNWSFTRESLRKAADAKAFRLLNDFEALALALPHLDGEDVVQIGGELPQKPGVKIVLGPGTGLGMATLAPLPHGGWMALWRVPAGHYLILLGSFGVLWSALQYVHHFGTERDVLKGARNLRTWRWLDALWLNHNWHRNHHARPTVPWVHLPEIGDRHDGERGRLLAAYLRMWRGPRHTDERVENHHAGRIIR